VLRFYDDNGELIGASLDLWDFERDFTTPGHHRIRKVEVVDYANRNAAYDAEILLGEWGWEEERTAREKLTTGRFIHKWRRDDEGS
jgi:hypothetical protein